MPKTNKSLLSVALSLIQIQFCLPKARHPPYGFILNILKPIRMYRIKSYSSLIATYRFAAMENTSSSPAFSTRLGRVYKALLLYNTELQFPPQFCRLMNSCVGSAFIKSLSLCFDTSSAQSFRVFNISGK